MGITFAVTLAILFILRIAASEVTHLSGARTGDGADERRSGALSDAQESAESQRNLPERRSETAVLPSSAESLHSAVQHNGHFGSFTAAVLGGAVVWMIQTVGKRLSGPR